MTELLIQTWVLGFVLSLAIAPVGCLILWRRVAFFADSMAHATFLGLALGICWGLSNDITVLLTSWAFAIGVLSLQRMTNLSSDLILAILAPVALSLGYIVADVLGQANLDPSMVLFGDMLAVSWWDILKLLAIAVILGITFMHYWRDIILINIDVEWAKVQGIRVKQIELMMMLMIAILVAFAAPVVGVLLITAMMVIPAATSMAIARSPASMIGWSTLITCTATTFGSGYSFYKDLPTGSTIVCFAFGFMLIAYSVRWLMKKISISTSRNQP